MSEASTTTSSLSHHDDIVAEEHEKYFTFFNLSIFLVAVTGVELVIIYFPFNPVFVYTSLMVLSVLKFVGVVWWFMHLRWDRILCTILFLMGMVLATGTVTALLFLFEHDPETAITASEGF